jgi:hypothetical protein
MANGPAGAPLTATGLAAQVAYHRSLYDLKPFLAVVESKDRVLSGEVSPGSKVTIRNGSQNIPAQVAGYQWTATLPAGMKPEQLEIRAQNAGGETVLPLRDSSFSHFQPEPAVKPGS